MKVESSTAEGSCLRSFLDLDGVPSVRVHGDSGDAIHFVGRHDLIKLRAWCRAVDTQADVALEEISRREDRA